MIEEGAQAGRAEPADHESSALSLDGVPVHFAVHGSGPTTLVLVHGWSNDRTYGEPHIRTLGPRRSNASRWADRQAPTAGSALPNANRY